MTQHKPYRVYSLRIAPGEVHWLLYTASCGPQYHRVGGPAYSGFYQTWDLEGVDYEHKELYWKALEKWLARRGFFTYR